MRAEFLQDDMDNIWFVNASNIQVRKSFGRNALDVLNDEALHEEKLKLTKEQ